MKEGTNNKLIFFTFNASFIFALSVGWLLHEFFIISTGAFETDTSAISLISNSSGLSPSLIILFSLVLLPTVVNIFVFKKLNQS